MKTAQPFFISGILLFILSFTHTPVRAQDIVKKIARRSCACFDQESRFLKDSKEVVNVLSLCIARHKPPFRPDQIELKPEFFQFRDSLDFHRRIREETDALCGERIRSRLRKKE